MTEERDLVDLVFLNRHMLYSALADKGWELRSSAYQYLIASPALAKKYEAESLRWFELRAKLMYLINELRNDG